MGILEELLAQLRWRLERRGFWHERRSLILERWVADRKSAADRQIALQATVEALKDPHTHISTSFDRMIIILVADIP